MEKKMENEMEIVVIKGLYRDPSIQRKPTLSSKVCKKFYLRWANWIPRVYSLRHFSLAASRRFCLSLLLYARKSIFQIPRRRGI